MEKLRDAEAARQGRHRFVDDNLSAPLARLAVVTQDPAAIPLLVQVHGIGAVRAALVAFGRLALPDLIRVVKDGGFDEAISCMITLRQLVQVKGVDYFTDAERAKLKLLVSLFLVPGDPMVRDDLSKRITMKRAVQLALVLDDAEAREWVQDIASSNDLYQAKTGSQYPEYYRGLLQEMLGRLSAAPRTETTIRILRNVGRERGIRSYYPEPIASCTGLLGAVDSTQPCLRLGITYSISQSATWQLHELHALNVLPALSRFSHPSAFTDQLSTHPTAS